MAAKKKPPTIVEYLGPHDAVDVLGYVDVKAGTTIDVTPDEAASLLEQADSWAARDAHTTQHGAAVDTPEES